MPQHILREVVKRLKSNLRAYDAIGRYGGEEFIIILSGCDKKRALERGEIIRYMVSEKPVDSSD